VHSIKELAELGVDKIKGKLFSLTAYGQWRNRIFSCIQELVIREHWCWWSSKVWAVGTIVRSLNLRLDDFPHTGAQSYGAIQIAIHSYSSHKH
jgi:hypothetical protein